MLAGFYGSVNEANQRITSLGVILQDTACTSAEIEEMLALQNLNTDDKLVAEEDDSNVGLIIAVVIIVLVAIALIAFGLFLYIRKRSKRNTVTFLDTNQPPTTNNSHQALPDVATEDGVYATARSEEKSSDRKKIIV